MGHAGRRRTRLIGNTVNTTSSRWFNTSENGRMMPRSGFD
jgi:hypothetical protein